MKQARISGEWYPVKRKTPWLIYLGVALVTLLLPLIFGFAIEITPTFIPVAFLVLLVLVATVIVKPEAVFFISIFGVLFIPQYKVQDTIMILTVAIAAFKFSQQGALVSKTTFPVWVKLLAGLFAIATASALLGLVLGDNEPKAIYDELRSFAYLVYLPLLLVIFPDYSARKLANVVLFSALVISLVVIPQGLFGFAFLGTGRVGALDTTGVGSIEASVTRVQISGIMIICSAFILATSRYFAAQGKSAIGYAALVLFYSLALYFNFGRAVWFWMIVAFSAVALLSGRKAVAQLMATIAVLIFSYILVKEIWNPVALTVLENRVLSVGSEGGYGTSYGWREIENREAFKTLSQTFGVGVGVGGEYRPFYIPLRVFPLHVRYIHQGYLYIALKLSLVGLMVYGALLVVGARSAFAKWGKDKNLNADLLGVGVTISAYLALNMTQPILMAYDGVLALSLVLAVLYRAETEQGVKSERGLHEQP